MRLRSIYRKRKRNRKEGRGRGIDHRLWPNRHFTELGLFSLETARNEVISLRKAVTGEPDAGEPLVRFGERGEGSIPYSYPYQRETE